MRTMRIEVSRAGAKSLITEDRMRVDVELEFYLRVQPTVDGVATAAQAIGSKSLSPDGVRNLLEGRFIDAIQATARDLHDGFAARQARRVRAHDPRIGAREPRPQRAAARVGVADAHGPGGVRLARRQQRVQRGRPAQARRDHRDEQEEARRDRGRRRRLGAPDPARGDQAAPRACRARRRRRRSASASRSKSSRRRATPTRRGRASSRPWPPRAARIEREQETRVAEIQKQRELRRLEIEAQLNSEVRKIDSSIALSRKHAEEAQARRRRPSCARTEIVLAQEQLQTERERAVAERSREIALKREQERGEVETSKARERDRGAADDGASAEASGDDDARRGAAHPSHRRIGGHARADRGRELAHRRADAHAARAAPARPHARDHRPDDEAGREDRQHPHPSGDRLRRLRRTRGRRRRRRAATPRSARR